jgi:hypothetical protein
MSTRFYRVGEYVCSTHSFTRLDIEESAADDTGERLISGDFGFKKRVRRTCQYRPIPPLLSTVMVDILVAH